MATLSAGPSPGGLSDGDVIGPYKILRRIGSGGMAEVFKARREDGVHSRSVAIKVIRQRWVGDEALEQRFRQEREILAALEHPGIARLLDGGVTLQGVPYVAMEYVEGSTLADYCSRTTVSLEEKLRLFLQLCSAVEYAHRNLIVHRDLKPNNVLVTVDGQVKLLDFGIAKLLRPDVWRLGAALTMAADRLATPEYASPEQLRGGNITTASDVYSLGILLYSMLTGRLPYQVTGSDWEVAVRIVNEAEIPPIENEAIPRDLEAIIRMAARKTPEDRYASVGHLREEIERHLAGRPVRARQGEWSYAVRLYVRRHAWPVALAAALVLVLAISALSLGLLARRLQQERDTAQATAEFIADMFGAADPFNKERTMRQVLDEAARRLPELRNQPQVQAALAEKIGDVYRQLGEYKLSRPLAEQAVALYLAADGGRSTDAARNMVRLADLLREQGEFKRAAELAERSLEIRRAELGRLDAGCADSLNMLGILRQIQGRAADAETAFKEAVEIRRVAEPGSTRLALSLGNLGNVLKARGDHAGAEKLYREALALRKKVWGPEHPRVASSLGQIAGTLVDQGHYMAALEATTEAMSILRRRLPPGHPEMPRTLLEHAAALRHSGRLEEAAAVAKEALEIHRKARGPESPEAALAQIALAKVESARGRFAEAEQLAGSAVEIRRKVLGEKHPSVAHGEKELAEIRRQRDKAR